MLSALWLFGDIRVPDLLLENLEALVVPIRVRTLTYIDFSPREYTGLLGRWELLKALTSVGKCPEQIYSRP